ncbi:VOC family protein [Pseudorhodobacter sp.]|uniref:VOC family protein n=1 Tax=Pseudorhodobacter sp. TaxID=1934400 RepID=UPI0026485AEF|nr:VOC family protein [Pseudorhodobacter sp.]MDN5787828.1 VOC family protein [Pseudorhodobacter sp.]
MTNRDGTPIWYELMTTVPDAAQKFYGAVMGWKFDKPAGGMERDYRTFATPEGEGVGGVMKAPEGAAFAPIWAAYFGVADVDAAAAMVKSLGGSVHMDPQDIPGVGRFAFVSDPQGALFYLMRGDSDRNSTAFSMMKSGHCCWNELVTSDQDAALAFYNKLFGWTKSGSMPMGEAGEYSFIGEGDDMIGAMMNAPKPNTAPYWNFAFTVPDIDVAKKAVERGGGKVRHGPMELPGDQGDWLIQADDPQGATVMFAGKRKAGAV